ncbi:MAG TPA: TonB-dependent receptor plug domain-containing protein, partial [Oxalicibacterium sp.]|nr:TonB-dependent receptor plug domain-containing protein [Oxalicibacterium sp.]
MNLSTGRHHRSRQAVLPFAILQCALVGAACAQNATPPATAENATELPAITVTTQTGSAFSPVVGYQATRASTATKTDTPIAETPQAITVITRDQITDQGATTLQDALTYAAGVRSDAYGIDSRTDSALIRGASPDVYIDGLRQANDYYT